jgi:hypothetical protein
MVGVAAGRGGGLVWEDVRKDTDVCFIVAACCAIAMAIADDITVGSKRQD